MTDLKSDYDAHKITESIVIDGDLTKPVWQNAKKTGRFVDMASGSPGFYDTRSACVWNDTHLYVGFWIEEKIKVIYIHNNIRHAAT